MTVNIAERYDDVSVICKANIYFGGKVASHTFLFKDGSRKTIGLIYPGSFRFNTEAPERMEIIAGDCRVRQADEDQWENYPSGTFFMVAGHASFEIAVEEGVLEYICSFE